MGVLGIALDLNFKGNDIFKRIRGMSSTIYFIHLWIWTAAYTVLYGEKTYGMSIFLITLTASVFIAYCYEVLLVMRKEKMERSNLR
jgi:hypothetical protein